MFLSPYTRTLSNNQEKSSLITTVAFRVIFKKRTIYLIGKKINGEIVYGLQTTSRGESVYVLRWQGDDLRFRPLGGPFVVCSKQIFVLSLFYEICWALVVSFSRGLLAAPSLFSVSRGGIRLEYRKLTKQTSSVLLICIGKTPSEGNLIAHHLERWGLSTSCPADILAEDFPMHRSLCDSSDM